MRQTLLRYLRLKQPKAPLFDNFIEQRIFDILSKNANVISQTIAANTIAIASAAIAQTMTTATRDAVKSEPINVARAIVSDRWRSIG